MTLWPSDLSSSKPHVIRYDMFWSNRKWQKIFWIEKATVLAFSRYVRVATHALILYLLSESCTTRTLPACLGSDRVVWFPQTAREAGVPFETHTVEKSQTHEKQACHRQQKQVIIEARVSKQNSDHKPLMEIPTDPRNGLGRLNAHVSAVLPAASHLCTFAQILLEPKGLWLNLTINFWLHWIHIARSYFKALLSIVRNWRPDGAGSGQLIRASSAEVNPGKWRKDGSRCAATLASGPWRAQ